MALQNANPIVYEQARERELTREERDDFVADQIDAREIFDILFKIVSLHRLRDVACSRTCGVLRSLKKYSFLNK